MKFKLPRKNLLLDDRRNPYDLFLRDLNLTYEHNDDFDVVKSYTEFIRYINFYGIPKGIISLDGDLDYYHYLPENQIGKIDYDSYEVKCGMHALMWLRLFCDKRNIQPPKILFHTSNQVMKKDMVEFYNEWIKS